MQNCNESFAEWGGGQNGGRSGRLPVFRAEEEKIEKPPKVVRAPIDFELVQKLYEQGMNDREIGEEAECSGCVVWKWRKKNKLPPNKRKKPY